MGSMTFHLPNPMPPAGEGLLRLARLASQFGGFGGFDQTPVPTHVAIADQRLTVSRRDNESGYLLVPWPIEPLGAFVTATTTLRERPDPYQFLVELARGKLNMVRTQTADWQAIGLQTTDEFDRALNEATRLFGQAVLNPGPGADATATRVLERAYNLADQVARMYAEQMFATRLQTDPQLRTRLAARFSSAPTGEAGEEYRRAFNAARVGFRWKDVEPAEARYSWETTDAAVAFAQAAGLPLTAGPVIDLSPGMIPDWAAGWAGDLPTLAAFMCDFLETVIGRYRGVAKRWVVCSGVNHTDGLGLSDDDRLRLSLRLLEAASQIDPELELILGVVQPWGDYLTSEEQTISPLSFADDLIRAGARISALEVEVRNGSTPRGSLPRDLLDLSRMLDLFGQLGAPLEVALGSPASDGPDPRAAEHGEAIWSAGWRGGPRPEGQAEWGVSFAAMALCKPHVRAVTWDHWSDSDPHITPHGGLVDAAGRVKPLLARLTALRNAYLV